MTTDCTRDQIAAVMLQHGTPQQQKEALLYLVGYPHNMSKTVGEQKDILVTVAHGTDDYDIRFIQQIEKAIDSALAPLGFSRAETEKGANKCTVAYFQFGKAL